MGKLRPRDEKELISDDHHPSPYSCTSRPWGRVTGLMFSLPFELTRGPE